MKDFTLFGYEENRSWFWDRWPFTAAMLWPLWLLAAVIIALAIRG